MADRKEIFIFSPSYAIKIIGICHRSSWNEIQKTVYQRSLVTAGDVLQTGLVHPALHVAVFVHAGNVVNMNPSIHGLVKHDGRAVFDRYNNSNCVFGPVRRFKNPSLAFTTAQRRLVCSSQATLAVASAISVAQASTSFFIGSGSISVGGVISAACAAPIHLLVALRPTQDLFICDKQLLIDANGAL